MTTRISTTKDELKAALIAEFAPEGFAPKDIRDEVLSAIDAVVSIAQQHRGDYHGFDAYLDAEITATV